MRALRHVGYIPMHTHSRRQTTVQSLHMHDYSLIQVFCSQFNWIIFFKKAQLFQYLHYHLTFKRTKRQLVPNLDWRTMTIFLGSVIMNQNETHSFTGNLFLPASPVYSVSLLRLSDRKLKITPTWTLQNKSVLERLWDNFNAWLPYNGNGNGNTVLSNLVKDILRNSFWNQPLVGVNETSRCFRSFSLFTVLRYFWVVVATTLLWHLCVKCK